MALEFNLCLQLQVRWMPFLSFFAAGICWNMGSLGVNNAFLIQPSQLKEECQGVTLSPYCGWRQREENVPHARATGRDGFSAESALIFNS